MTLRLALGKVSRIGNPVAAVTHTPVVASSASGAPATSLAAIASGAPATSLAAIASGAGSQPDGRPMTTAQTQTRSVGAFLRERIPLNALSLQSSSIPTHPYVFRGGKFSPAIAKFEGYAAGNADPSVCRHVDKEVKRNEQGQLTGEYDQSGYVSTSESLVTAVDFARRSQSINKVVCVMQRPALHVGSFVDIPGCFKQHPYIVIDEAELAAYRVIPGTDIIAYKSYTGGFDAHSWTLNPYHKPRDYSVAYDTVDPKERDKFKLYRCGYSYFYMSYAQAQSVKAALESVSKEYGSEDSKHMVCIDRLDPQDVAKFSGKQFRPSLADEFSAEELTGYSVEVYRKAQEAIGRRPCIKTYGFSEGPTLFASAALSSKDSKEEVANPKTFDSRTLHR